MSLFEHVVVKGDTLWAITEKHLSDPYEWPRIWKFNNRKEIMAITGTGIPNPDLIYVGQRILIPELQFIVKMKPSQAPKKHGSNSPRRSGGSLRDQLEGMNGVTALAFDLGQIPLITSVGPGYVAKISIKGSVVLKSRQGTPMVQSSMKPGVKTTRQVMAENAFTTLMSEHEIQYDAKAGTVKLGSMLVSKSTTPNLPSFASGIEMSASSPIPKLKFEIRYPKLKGYIQGFSYVAMGVKYVIELTPTAPPPPSRTPVTTAPTASMVAKTAGGVIIFAAGVVIVATIVEDFMTLGAGVADDPASFAAAGGMTALGRGLWAGRIALPRMSPTVLRLSFMFTPVGMSTAAYALGHKTADSDTEKPKGP